MGHGPLLGAVEHGFEVGAGLQGAGKIDSRQIVAVALGFGNLPREFGAPGPEHNLGTAIANLAHSTGDMPIAAANSAK